MQRKIIITADGSTTIHLPEWDEQYHSKHGAIQETYHVFVNSGLHYYFSRLNEADKKDVSILEIGFGTGLNAFITLLEAEKLNIKIDYVGVEAYPVDANEIEQLNYSELISKNHQDDFKQLHNISWEKSEDISKNFTLTKQQKFFKDISATEAFDIIYFDAFGARVQPELWTESIFKTMFEALKSKGVLVTYSAKGSVRRAMQAVGFKVERLPGPPGKREMLRAIKTSVSNK